MSLQSIFQSMKKEQGSLIRELDQFLVSHSMNEENDRAIDVNAPSQVGVCLRSRFYARTKVQPDSAGVSARTQRIFDNGTHVHLRLQKYLKDMGVLLMEEVPIREDDFNIQGHADGLIEFFGKKVLELKSINSKGFQELRDAKPEHKEQALVYLYSLEKRRNYLRDKYKSLDEFNKDYFVRKAYYRSLYQHLRDGKHYTREQKISFQCGLHNALDRILIFTDEPISEVVFWYENKDTQDIKEFTVKASDNEELIHEVLEEYSYLNTCVDKDEVPPRPAHTKSDPMCRFCSYKIECWG